MGLISSASLPYPLVISHRRKYLYFILFLPFNTICLWSHILECELSPVHQLRVAMLILTLFCPRLWVSPTFSCGPHWNGHKALGVKFHHPILVTRPWHYIESISAVDGTVSKAECDIRTNIQSIQYLNKKWVLLSPHKHISIDSSLFQSLSLFQYKWTLSRLFGRLFSFSCCF